MTVSFAIADSFRSDKSDSNNFYLNPGNRTEPDNSHRVALGAVRLVYFTLREQGSVLIFSWRARAEPGTIALSHPA
jgi:hypothetical protein